jgi:Holliday junction resolvase RusA-like endonuclease
VTSLVNLFVPGVPRPQGSKQAFRNQHSGRIAVVESSKHVKTWRDDIRGALLDRLPSAAPFTYPVTVCLGFVMPRPKFHYRTGRNAHLLRDTAPPHPIGKPDVDKLARAVLDAIGSAGVWVDDSQVVELHAAKGYGRTTGVLIEIQDKGAPDQWAAIQAELAKEKQ